MQTNLGRVLVEQELISLVIPLMRKSSIKDLLEHYESNQLIEEIVLVDFDAGYTFSIVAQRTEKLKHLSVTNEKYFNKSLALNIGIHTSTRQNILCCDADVLIDQSVITNWYGLVVHSPSTLCSLEFVAETACGTIRPGYGILLGARSAFEAIRGYDSEFCGWGFEDLNFINRAELAGMSINRSGIGSHISHDDFERMNNYKNRDKKSSRATNLEKFEHKKAIGQIFGTLAEDIKHEWTFVS